MVVRLSNTAQSRRKRGDPANTTAAPPFSHECMWRARRRATRVYLVLERVRAATPFIVEKEVSCGPSAPGRFHQPQARDICEVSRVERPERRVLPDGRRRDGQVEFASTRTAHEPVEFRGQRGVDAAERDRLAAGEQRFL